MSININDRPEKHVCPICKCLMILTTHGATCPNCATMIDKTGYVVYEGKLRGNVK